MDYKDVVKFVKNAKLDLKSLVHLARIEDEFGKEAVIASLTYSMPREIPNVPTDVYYYLQYHYHDFAASMNQCPSSNTYSLQIKKADKNQSVVMNAFQGMYQVLPNDYKYGYICCYSEMNNMNYVDRKKVVINMEFSQYMGALFDYIFSNDNKNAFDLPILKDKHLPYPDSPVTPYKGFLSILAQYKLIYNYYTKDFTKFSNMYVMDEYTWPFILFIKKDDFTLRFNIFYFNTSSVPYTVVGSFLNFDIPYDWSQEFGMDEVYFSYNFIDEFDNGDDFITVTHYNHNLDADQDFWQSPEIINTFKKMIIK